MWEIINAKVACVPGNVGALQSSKQIIVETVRFDTFWSCGLNEYEALICDGKPMPGRNIIGKLYMRLKILLQ